MTTLVGPAPQLPAYARSVSATAELEGPVHYLRYDGPEDGPLFVLVHGLGGSHANWLAIAPALAERGTVLVVDLAGHGLTPTAGRKTDVHTNRRLLDRFLRSVARRPAILIGNSMGGAITVLQASKAPETVAACVLIDPVLPAPRRTLPDRRVGLSFALYALPRAPERIMARRRRRLGPEGLVRETLMLCTVDVRRVPPPVVEAHVALSAMRMDEPDADRAFLGAARSIVALAARPKRYASMLGALQAPTLLLFGARDRLVKVEAGRLMAARRRDWRYAEHADLGHVPMLEDPAWTLEQIAGWLDHEVTGAGVGR